MPYNGKKIFICDVDSCRQTFGSADKLSSHERSHKLHITVMPPTDIKNSPNGSRPDDTPARFTKLMDDAGLVQDLSNPFDASFRKAGENPSAIGMIDSEIVSSNIPPPTTADILQEVVEQEQPLWKQEGSDQRAPVITSRHAGPLLLAELSDSCPRSLPHAGNPPPCNVSIKISESPPPAATEPTPDHGLNPSGINHVLVSPMVTMFPHTASSLNLNRHYPTQFSPAAIATPHETRAQALLNEDSVVVGHAANKVSMKRKSNGSSDDEEERKRKFRENNKLAAQRCRQRKKQEIEDTRKERDRLREDNQKLTAKLELCLQNEEKLRDQVEKLKIELSEHAQCNVSLKKRGVIQYLGL